MVRIYSQDDCREIAKKIWEGFSPGDMCQVFGFVTRESDQKVIPKGEVVLLLLIEAYEKKFYNGERRKFEYKPDSIGGPIAHPIFTWKKHIIDNEPRFTIWRVQ